MLLLVVVVAAPSQQGFKTSRALLTIFQSLGNSSLGGLSWLLPDFRVWETCLMWLDTTLGLYLSRVEPLVGTPYFHLSERFRQKFELICGRFHWPSGVKLPNGVPSIPIAEPYTWLVGVVENCTRFKLDQIFPVEKQRQPLKPRPP